MQKKTCRKCTRLLPTNCFSPHGTGFHSYCKSCRRAYRREKYKENPEPVKLYQRIKHLLNPTPDNERNKDWHKRNPLAGSARNAVSRALSKGALEKPKSCERCGNKRNDLHAHHHKGYKSEYRLDVQWLCPSCHKYTEMQKYVTQ